jgi:hypothetical protein
MRWIAGLALAGLTGGAASASPRAATRIVGCQVDGVYQQMLLPAKSLAVTSQGLVEPISAFYGPTAVQGATYDVTVTRKAKDFYLVDDKNIYLHTVLCLELSAGQPAVFESDGAGGGRLTFTGVGSP